jgi:hypothetical protein
MGVQTYLLDRRRAILTVDAYEHEVGILRRFWKITEIDETRAAELREAEAGVRGTPPPPAVMLADSVEMPLIASRANYVKAHLVLGWDADRASVTDYEWEYLPPLGYAVRNPEADAYVLHENDNGILRPVMANRAVELGLLSQCGDLIRRGQPLVAECRSVRPFINAYVQADCVLTDGRTAEIVTFVEPGNLPNSKWYAGKRPVDVARYPGNEPLARI